MGFGRYRFRRSFGNVSSQFRGARFDTYPLNPYPLAGRVLDLSSFDYSLPEVPDISGEGNNAVLYSARGINLAGAGYAELPNVGATKSITVLARSSTDTTLYATDDATQTEDASVTLVANDTWQEVTLTFASAISGAIRLGTNGTNFFSGDLADAVCKDASGSKLDQFYLNEHTDTSFEGIDGLPLVGRNGNVGQYVDAAAVVQEGIPLGLAGLGAYGDYQWFNGVDTFIDLGSQIAFAGPFDVRASVLLNDVAAAQVIMGGESVNNSFIRVVNSGADINVNFTGSATSISLDAAILPLTPTEIRVTRNVDDLVSVYVDGVLQSNTITFAGSFRVERLGARNSSQNPIGGLIYDVNLNNQAAYLGYGPTPWSDTIGSNDGTPSGTFATVAQLRTTPPQVLGMNFNRYYSLNGLNQYVETDKIITGNFNFKVPCILGPVGSASLILDGRDSGGDGVALTLNADGSIALDVNGSAFVTSSTVFSELDVLKVNGSYDGTNVSLVINDNFEGTTPYAGTVSVTTNVRLGARSFNTPSAFFSGIVGGLSVEESMANLSPVNSPEQILVPASLSNSSLDALGNAMDLRERDEFNFDGSGYAVVPYDPSLDVTDEFSVVIDSFDFDPTTDVERVISRYDSPNNERIFGFIVNNTSALSSGFSALFGDPNNGGFEGRYDWSLTTAGTYKLAFVYDGKLPASERIKLYTQDGEPSGSLVSGSVPASLPQFDQDLVIGATEDGSGQLATTRAGGILHYNRALTAEEVATFL